MDNNEINTVKSALEKRALGYDSTEITEEYAEDKEGVLRMQKRKVVQKNVPPDVSALKLLFELNGNKTDLSSLTDEELESEKLRLIKILKENQNDVKKDR